MANLERRKYRDVHGKKRRKMTYKRAWNWLKIHHGKQDLTVYYVIALSLLLSGAFFALAHFNHLGDKETLVEDSDQDKQWDNPEDMNDGPFSFSLGLRWVNESRDADPTESAIDTETDPAAWSRSYPEISTLDYIVFGFVSLFLPYGIYGGRRAKYQSMVEEKFPDFLRDLGEYWKGGLSMTVAVQTLAKGEYGNLNEEVHRMASQISWGVSFGEVLRMFTERVSSPLVTRAVNMVEEANRAGGTISDILLAASYDAREILSLGTERAQEVGTYTMVIYMSFFVYLGIIVILSKTFIPAIADSSTSGGGGESMSIGNMKVKEIDEIWIASVFFYSVVVQSIGNGFAAGFMATGKFYGSAKRAAYMLLIGWISYELIGIGTSILASGKAV